jgi:hypothetical protein
MIWAPYPLEVAMQIIKYVGQTAETETLVNMLRRHPTESDDDVIQRALRSLVERPTAIVGCDLGSGVRLAQDEAIKCYVRLASMDNREPDGVAVARDGALFIDGQRVLPRRSGKWLQAALSLVQKRVGHLSPSTGEPISLDAWEHWFVTRNGERVAVDALRDPDMVQRRLARSSDLSHFGADELGL